MPRNLPENAVFFQIGLRNNPAPNYLNLSAINQLAKINNSEINLLKVDIEGNEYEALHNVEFSAFAVVIIEFHSLEKVLYSDLFYKFQYLYDTLNLKHQVFHAHANNWSYLFNFANIALPNVVEVTFIRRNLLSTIVEESGAKLDYPCREGYREIWPLG